MSDVRRRRAIRALLALALLGAAAGGVALVAGEEAQWDPKLDAVAAAPDSHRVLFENETVRVLEVILRPGEREPAHTHRWSSVMVGVESARIRYYDEEGNQLFETPADRDLSGPIGANWMGPEPAHAVENIDDRTFRAIRFELKDRGGS